MEARGVGMTESGLLVKEPAGGLARRSSGMGAPSDPAQRDQLVSAVSARFVKAQGRLSGLSLEIKTG